MKGDSVFKPDGGRALAIRVGALVLVTIQVVSLLACTDFTPPPDATPEVPGPVITSDKDAYSWTIDKSAVFTLSNPEGAPVYWVACPEYRLQRYENGWKTVRMQDGVFAAVRAADGFSIDGACDPHPLAPGQTVEYHVPLTNDWIEKAGWYRLELNLVRDAKGDMPWALRSRTSRSVSIAPRHAGDASGQ